MEGTSTIYGLKQAPRIWAETLCSYLDDLGLVMLQGHPSVFYKEDEVDKRELKIQAVSIGPELIVTIYVDDFMVIGKSLADDHEVVDMGSSCPCQRRITIVIFRIHDSGVRPSLSSESASNLCVKRPTIEVSGHHCCKTTSRTILSRLNAGSQLV